MLQQAHAAGVANALARFGVKEASIADKAMGMAGEAGRALFGNPLQVAREGVNTFRPGGLLHHKNVLWPSIPGRPVVSALGKASTVLSALPLLSAVRGGGDPNEGRLSNTLSAAGNALGMAYGFPAAGVIGGPLLGRAGAALGRGVGHVLGSRPRPQAPPAPPAPPQQDLMPFPMTGGY